MIELTYLSIDLPTRERVSEPMPSPEMRLVRCDGSSSRTAGTVVKVPLTEAQLLAIVKDCTTTLDRMRVSRDATRPGRDKGTDNGD